MEWLLRTCEWGKIVVLRKFHGAKNVGYLHWYMFREGLLDDGGCFGFDFSQFNLPFFTLNILLVEHKGEFSLGSRSILLSSTKVPNEKAF